MKPSRVDYVSKCETCPFMMTDDSYQGPTDSCAAANGRVSVTADGRVLPLDGDAPPDWCPLRAGPSLVVLAVRK